MVRFSPANVKIKELASVEGVVPFLQNKRKVYSFDLISGWSCPFADQCLSKVKMIDGKHKIVDGPNTRFRCFSASQEVIFPAVYAMRKANFDELRKLDMSGMINAIESAMPSNLGVCRIHVAGDFFSPDYFGAWLEVARNNPDRLFYAYTKSIPYWIREKNAVKRISNIVLTASLGGRCDLDIVSNRLRRARVVFSENEAAKLGLEIDHDDSHAADPTKRRKSFALLIHGIQPANSEAQRAIQTMKKGGVKFSYSR